MPTPPSPGPGHSNATFRTERIKIPLSGQEGRRVVDVLNQFFAYNPCLTLRDVRADVRYTQRYGGSNALFTIFYSTPIGTRYFVEEFFGDADVTAAARAEQFLEANDTVRVIKIVDISSPERVFENEQRLLIFYVDKANLYQADVGMAKAGVPGSAGGDIAPNDGATMGDPIEADRPGVWVWNYGEVDWPAGAPFLIFKTEDRLNEWAGVPPCCYGDKGSQGPFNLEDLCGIPGDFGSNYTTFLTTTFTATTTAPILPNLRFGSNKPTSLSTTTTTPPPSVADQFNRIGIANYFQDFDWVNGVIDEFSVAVEGGEEALTISGNAAYSPLLFGDDCGILLPLREKGIYGDFTATLRGKTSQSVGSLALIFHYQDRLNYSYYTANIAAASGRNRFAFVRDGVVTGSPISSSTISSDTYVDLKIIKIGENARVFLDGVLVLNVTDPLLDSKGIMGVGSASTFGRDWAISSFDLTADVTNDCCRREIFTCVQRRNAENVGLAEWRLAEVECIGNDNCTNSTTLSGNTLTVETKDGCDCQDPKSNAEVTVVDTVAFPPPCASSCYQVTSYWIEDDEKDCTQITVEVDTALSAALGTRLRGRPEKIVEGILRGTSVSVSCSEPTCTFDHVYQFPSSGAFTNPTLLEEVIDPGGEIVVAVGFEEKAQGIADGVCPNTVQQYRSMQILVTLVPTGEVCDE